MAKRQTVSKPERRSRKKAAGKKAAAKPAKAKNKGTTLALPQVELIPVSKLKPSVNARTHSPEQIALIAAAIEEFGWMNPPLVDGKGFILAGHGRWEAAKLLGLATMPAIKITRLTAKQKRAYVLADNRLAELAGWDVKLLAIELGALGDVGFDLGVIGWDPDQVRQTIAEAGRTLQGSTDPDAAPDFPEHAICRLGDLWSLGHHRLLCGDATAGVDVTALLEGRVAPGLMVTEPPYGVNYDAAWRIRSGVAKGENHTATGKVANDDRSDWREAWALFPGDVAYVWHAGTKAHLVSESLEASNFRIRAQIIWVKSRFAISRGAYHHQHEPVFLAQREGSEDDHWQESEEQPDQLEGLDPFQRFEADHENLLYSVRANQTASWRGGRKQSTVWNIEHIKSETGHSTQKPVEAMRRPMENNSAPGDSVYDPFIGSGTSFIAAEMSGRICYGLEVIPGYMDVAIRRWQDFTSKTAVLESTGQSWTEVVEERI